MKSSLLRVLRPALTILLSIAGAASAQPYNGLWFDSPPGDFIGQGLIGFYIAPPSTLSAEGNYQGGVNLTLDGSDGTRWNLNFAAGGLNPLAPGHYENAVRYPFNGASPGLSMSSESRGCNTLTGRFIVWDIAYGTSPIIERFAADFVQECDGGPQLLGQIRYNSTVPLSVFISPEIVGGLSFDFNGDGRKDLLWHHADGSYGVWLMNGAAASGYGVIFYGGSGVEIVLAADVNGDGKTDLIGRYPDGRVRLWFMDGLSAWAAVDVLPAGSEWRPVHTGDFDGDGRADLLWKHSDGSYGIWLMEGFAPKQYGIVFYAGNGYDIVHVADVDGNGTSDLIGIHEDGHARAWLIQGIGGTAAVDLTEVGSFIAPVATGDFNADGRADLVMRLFGGRHFIILMAGLVALDIVEVHDGQSMNVEAIGDFDGDGRDDIAWRDLGGNYKATSVREGFVTGFLDLEPTGTGWSIVSVNDHGGDQRGDIVWRHTDGRHRIFQMNGGSPPTAAQLVGPGGSWNVVP